jgi:rod shape-determining protein MreC
LLVTSGLGGRFPRGYPVGTVQEVIIDPNASFAVVNVLPAAQLDRSRHVLVVVGEPTPTIPDHALAPAAAGTNQAPKTGDAAVDGATSDATAPVAVGSVQ